MKQALRFTKMHAVRNDFMLLNMIRHPRVLKSAEVRRWADRQRGIGFDQLLCAEPPRAPTADFFMRVYNADGTSAEQCGNGLRCFYVFVHHQGLTTRNPLIVETEQRLARVEEDNTGQIVAEMEEVDWNWHNILVPPLAEQQKKPNKAEPAYFKVLNHLGKEERISAYPVSLGNPHLIVFTERSQHVPVLLNRFGSALVNHPALKEGANVGFVSLPDPATVVMRTYERGSGATLACGSNACAAAALAMKVKGAASDLTVRTPGGRMRIYRRGRRLVMQSKVHTVYHGCLP